MSQYHTRLLPSAISPCSPSQVGFQIHHCFSHACLCFWCGIRTLEETLHCLEVWCVLVDGGRGGVYGGINKEVAVIVKSDEDTTENCVSIFNKVISCVMEAKAEFCNSIQPEFFIFDPTNSENGLTEDNLFAMSDVQRVLSSREKKFVLSVTGKSQLKRERVACMLKFTLWNVIFPMDFATLLPKLQNIVKDLYTLGIHLNIPQSLLDAIEMDHPSSVERRRIEMVKTWISFSPDSPCWWQLVQALNLMNYRVLATEIESEHSISVQLQKTLLTPENHNVQPDDHFLELLAGVIGDHWPTLSSALSLTGSEVEEAKKKHRQFPHSPLTFHMLKEWAARKDATYGQLCDTLKTSVLFQ